ncbi:POT family protein [Loa loa]|uniref:POT family protein n=1 Tax=Loa loa TaxID=7209 RepID=A0A1I7VY78_LOALO|nr:POT family protein [Loa loa]EFO24287.2 POT family protein [Loa loa]
MGGGRKGLLASVRTYPPGVFFMLGNEFCERFSFYGMRAILMLYLIIEHHFSESQASLFYHSFIALAYISPLLGSIAADNYFGRFRVILWMSAIYVIGHILLTVGAIPELERTFRLIFDFGGLAIIAFATGGIKPCVSAFAADQFDEKQVYERNQFFSFFYFAINAGSLLAILLTPILRGRVKCFGSEYCFPLAFGVPGVLMLLAFILFLAGWRYYKIVPPAKGNIVFSVVCCICYAARKKICSFMRGGQKVEHWLDYAAPKYSSNFLDAVKCLVDVSVLFGPVVLFWALFDQQGSTWVLQACRMNGRVGPFMILPDQMNILNPLFVLITVPMFEAWVYPLVQRVCKVTPLRKMATGGCLAALAFVMAGLLQLEVNKTMEPHPERGRVILQTFGDSSHSYEINGTKLTYGKTDLPEGLYTVTSNSIENVQSFQLNLSSSESGYVLGLFESSRNKSIFSSFPYNCEKTENGGIRLYLLVAGDSILANGSFYIVDSHGNIHQKAVLRSGQHLDIHPALISSPEYVLKIGPGNCAVTDCPFNYTIYAEAGGAHVVYITENDIDLYTVVRPNTVNILWQLPQFFVITIGEVLFSVTGLEFSYSQAPPNMKSVLQAIWLMTVFLGNVIDMLISGSHIVAEPATEFFIYAFMTVIVIGLFIALAIGHHYNNYTEDGVARMEYIEKPLSKGNGTTSNMPSDNTLS